MNETIETLREGHYEMPDNETIAPWVDQENVETVIGYVSNALRECAAQNPKIGLLESAHALRCVNAVLLAKVSDNMIDRVVALTDSLDASTVGE